MKHALGNNKEYKTKEVPTYTQDKGLANSSLSTTKKKLIILSMVSNYDKMETCLILTFGACKYGCKL
jgi:hypothetical protein